MATGSYQGQPPPVQAPHQARAGDRFRQTRRRPGTRDAEQHLQASGLEITSCATQSSSKRRTATIPPMSLTFPGASLLVHPSRKSSKKSEQRLPSTWRVCGKTVSRLHPRKAKSSTWSPPPSTQGGISSRRSGAPEESSLAIMDSHVFAAPKKARHTCIPGRPSMSRRTIGGTH